MSTDTSVMQSPAPTERTLRIALQSLTLRAHRLWLSEPEDHSRSLPLCEELFDLQIQIQRLELQLEARPFDDHQQQQLEAVTTRLERLEYHWRQAKPVTETTARCA